MSRFATAAALSAALVLVQAPDSGACTCRTAAPRAQLAGAAAVFSGQATSSIALADGSVLVRFEVDRVYKGSFGERTDVRTSAGEGGCGIPFTAGRRYLVFARSDASGLVTGLCDGSTTDLDVLEREGSSSSGAPPGDAAAAGASSAAGAPADSRAAPLAAAWALLLGVAGGWWGIRLRIRRA
jgi:hypothetical protein